MTSQRTSARKQRVAEALSTTPRRVLATFAAIGAITGAITGVIKLLPKPPDTLTASVDALSASPEMRLEEYDERKRPIEGTAHASTGIGTISYRLAADIATGSSAAPAAQPEAEHAEGPSTGKHASEPGGPSSELSHPEGATSGGEESTDTSAGSTPAHTKRAGGEVMLEPLEGSYPKEVSDASLAGRDTPPARGAQHNVDGAVVSEGDGKVPVGVGNVMGLVATGAKGEAPAGDGVRVVLPRSCHTGRCGAAQVIERAMTYDPNPVRAAQAAMTMFKNSRSERVGNRLYPLGAMVSYTVNLRGFAHKHPELRWALTGGARKHRLPRPWWHDIVVARIKPTVNEETLSGTFWVPLPPAHGHYQVHLIVLDEHEVEHGWRDSAPFR
jgi:hypothetical protein